MKKSLILCLIFLALAQGQNLVAQTGKSDLISAKLQTPLDVTGEMVKTFRKKKESSSSLTKPRRTRYSTSIYKLDRFRFTEVNYDPQAKEWRLAGEAADSRTGKVIPMWIRYQEWNSLLQISLVRQRAIMWSIPRTDSIKVTIPDDKSSFRLDFLKTIEGNGRAGSDHFWEKDSWLLAPR